MTTTSLHVLRLPVATYASAHLADQDSDLTIFNAKQLQGHIATSAFERPVERRLPALGPSSVALKLRNIIKTETLLYGATHIKCHHDQSHCAP